MTKISVLGVAIGVATLVIVLSVMGGLESNLRHKMFRGMPHLEIFSAKTLMGFSLDEVPFYSLSKQPEVTRVEPFIQADVVMKQGENLAPVTLFGLDKDLGGEPWGFRDHFIEGSFDKISEPILRPKIQQTENEEELASLPGIILGESLAARLSARYGDVINILNPQMSMSTVLGGGSAASLFQVRGSFYTGLPKYDAKYALVLLPHARKFMPDYDDYLEEENYVTGLAINIKDPESVEGFGEKLAKELGLKVRTWKDANKSLIFALKLEKYTMGAILFLIVLVAAFSISGTLMMSVYYKRGQISILSSLGLDEKGILWLHLAHGFTIGTLGSLLGLFLGLSFCAFLASDLPSLWLPSVLQSYLYLVPIKFLSMEYAVIGLSAVFLSLLAALYPAFVASRQASTEGLRYL